MQTETLIIGAGLAGLALADHLKRAGRDVLIFEARPRSGGRILTRSIQGVAADLGPAWFWPGQPRVAALAARFGIGVFEQASEGDGLFEQADGRIQRGTGLAGMQGSLRLKGGLGRLPDALAAEVEDALWLTSPATRLTLLDNAIQVDFGGENGSRAVSASRVILAVPPRLSADLSFDPPLPKAAMAALTAIPTWMAGQAKVVAVYDQPHWRIRGLSGDAVSQKGPMVEIHDASPADGRGYAVFGFLGVPPEGRQIHRHQLPDLALSQLARLFGAEMTHPSEILLQDWAQEPATATPADHRNPALHPQYGPPAALSGLWDGRLLFGSSEMALEFGGYLEGALHVAEGLFQRIVQAER